MISETRLGELAEAVYPHELVDPDEVRYAIACARFVQALEPEGWDDLVKGLWEYTDMLLDAATSYPEDSPERHTRFQCRAMMNRQRDALIAALKALRERE